MRLDEASIEAPLLVRVAARTHVALVPALWLVLSVLWFALIYQLGDGANCCWENSRQLWGGIITYSAIPAYLTFAGVLMWRRSRATLLELAPLIEDFESARLRVLGPDLRLSGLLALVGVVFGVSQFTDAIPILLAPGETLLNVSMLLLHLLMWGAVGWVTAYRIRSAIGFYQIGAGIPVDLYRLSQLRPFAVLALFDLLVVMGALTLAPLQALDAEFRWVNYQAGLTFALPAAAFVFLVPMLGVRRAILSAKEMRVLELQALIDVCDRADVGKLDGLLGHQERIRDLHSWPVDLRLIAKVGFYLVIPPLAWVGAALVENLVDLFLN